MTFPLRRAALPALAAVLTATPAFADTTLDRGDTAWMIVATVLVLLMIVPGLALFYGGLVRAKNLLSVLTQVMAIACMVTVIWVTYGYTSPSPATAPDRRLLQAFLAGITPESLSAAFRICLSQLPDDVACITTALIVGGIAERMRFAALLAFAALWVTFVYFPCAHGVVGERLPDEARRARLRRRHRGSHQLRHRRAGWRLDARQAHRLWPRPPGAALLPPPWSAARSCGSVVGFNAGSALQPTAPRRWR